LKAEKSVNWKMILLHSVLVWLQGVDRGIVADNLDLHVFVYGVYIGFGCNRPTGGKDIGISSHFPHCICRTKTASVV
jgi:hypothetical protein